METTANPTCPSCQDDLDGPSAALCSTCFTPHHDGCFAKDGNCSKDECDGTRMVPAESPPAIACVKCQRPTAARAERCAWCDHSLDGLSPVDHLFGRSPPRPVGSPDEAPEPSRPSLALAIPILAVLGIPLAVILTNKGPEKVAGETPRTIEVSVGQVVRVEVPWSADDPPERPPSKAAPWPDGTLGPSLYHRDPYHEVEWPVPRVEGRSFFLVHGLKGGRSSFELRFPTSKRVQRFPVLVKGVDTHEDRTEYRKQLQAKSAPELLSLMEVHFGAGWIFTQERDKPGKEARYRLAWLEHAEAAHAAHALNAKGTPLDDEAVAYAKSCVDVEAWARKQYEAFVSGEIGTYLDMVKRDEPVEARADQLARVVRAISHECDVRYQRFSLLLEHTYGKPLAADGTERCEHGR